MSSNCLLAKIGIIGLNGLSTGILCEMVCEKKNGSRVLCVIRPLCFFLFNVLACAASLFFRYPLMSLPSLLFNGAGLAALMFLFYKVRPGAVFMMLTMEFFSVIMVSVLMLQNQPGVRIHLSWPQDPILPQMLFACLLLFILKTGTGWMYAVKEGRKKRTGLFAAAVSVAAAAAAGLACIVFSWYRSRGSEKEFYSLFVLISMLFAAWSVLFLYQKHILEKKCRDLQESWNAQNAYGKALDQSRISMEKVRHDYKNIVISLRYLMDQKKYEDVRSLLGECYTRVEADKVESFCSIPALNGILLAKKEICRKENIEFDADFRIAKAEIDIPVHDLCLAAGNLLDNAIRACRRMEKTEKVIRMKGHVIQGYLIFECLNTCPDEKEGTIHGTGYGHQILQDLARQYGGSFTAGRKQKEIYQSTLLLKAGTRTRAESAG